MGSLTPDEQAAFDMLPTWKSLDAVRAKEDALRKFILEEVPPGTKPDAAGISLTLPMVGEFNEIWPHPTPELWDLVVAHRAGRLDEKIRELNEAYTGAR